MERYAIAALAAVLLTGVMAVPARAGTLIINGSFESGVPRDARGLSNHTIFGDLDMNGPGWDRWRVIDGWRTIRGPGIEVQSNRALATVDAQDGSRYVELDSSANSTMAQTVALSVGTHVLTFWYSPRTDDARSNVIEYTLGGLAGGRLDTDLPGAAVGIWTEVRSIFRVVQAGSYDLQFAAAGRGDSVGGLIDNVSLAAVPLPATGLGLIGALAGLTALRRRRGRARG